MLQPVSDETKGIDVDVVLTDIERGQLAAFVKTEAFDVFQRLCEDQVKKYNIRLVNTDPTDPDTVLINHGLAHAVGRFYVGLMSRLKEEFDIENYNSRARFEDTEAQ